MSAAEHGPDRQVRWRRHDDQVVEIVVDLLDGSVVSACVDHAGERVKIEYDRGVDDAYFAFSTSASARQEKLDDARVDLDTRSARAIDRLVIEPAEPWTKKQKAALRQEHLDLGGGQTKHVATLEQIPWWTFSYKFDCDEAACKGHKLQILDWEIAESFRRWSRSDPDRWEDMIRTKYERELPGKDLHLVVGTMATHPKTFVIIGLVYPPWPQMDGLHVQQTLDLMGQQRTMTGVGVGLETQEAGTLGGDEGQDALQLFPDEA